jgi:hypothetical protein
MLNAILLNSYLPEKRPVAAPHPHLYVAHISTLIFCLHTSSPWCAQPSRSGWDWTLIFALIWCNFKVQTGISAHLLPYDQQSILNYLLHGCYHGVTFLNAMR